MVAAAAPRRRRTPREERERIGRWLREENPPREARVALAEAKRVTSRTLCSWKHLDPAKPAASPGRPRLSEERLHEASEAVRGELERQGWQVGEGPIHRALGGRFPLARIRRVLKELKAEHRARKRKHVEEARKSMRSCARDAVWAIDATHLGRNLLRMAVEAEVIRELASTRTIGISIGLPATAEEVIALLERTARERGTLPLVLICDNGPAYRSERVREWCKQHKIILLYSLPRTPQHNGACEHGMRELKGEAMLGKGVLVLDTEEVRARLEESVGRIDGCRLRTTRDWKTAVEADECNTPWSALVDRERVYAEITCAVERALIHSTGERARRRAKREAILDTLQQLNLITRTRGGRPWTAHKAEDDL